MRAFCPTLCWFFAMFVFAPSSFSQSTDIEALIAEMTLAEKVGQMTQIELGVVSVGEGGRDEPHRLDPAKLRTAVVGHNVGSILNVINHSYSLAHWHEVIGAIQRIATEETRLGIPIIYGIDAVHGVNYTEGGTLFPQNIALAATFDPEMARRIGHVTAIETRASGIPWNFSPVLDLGRQPLWPRFYETLGEDAYLAAELGRALIEGYQGEDVGDPDRVAATMKHFVGYSYPVSGKDRTTALIPERQLRQLFLPTFQAAVEAGAKTVMVNSGDVNGIPVHASKFLLEDVLRDELGFDGVIVTDWEDVNKLHSVHRVAASPKDAVRLTVEAGVDMAMVPYDFSFYEHLIALVEEGVISEERIDESVRRILRLKEELGLFERPGPDFLPASRFADAAAQELNLQAARDAITLLKNEGGLLPLRKDQRVLVTGPAARSMTALNGGWTYTWQGQDSTYVGQYDLATILDAVRQQVGGAHVRYAPGTTFEDEVDVASAVSLARQVDVAVVCVGEDAYAEKPGDIDDLTLSAVQLRLVEAIAATGTPVVLVLVEGRPRIITSVVDNVDAIVMAYQPGNEGGPAIAEVLYGEVNPSGKLPFTYPRAANDLVAYDHEWSATTGQQFGGIGRVAGFNPLFPFGHGLSYTTFAYSNLNLGQPSVGVDGEQTVTITVTNTGSREGVETVQLYLSDLYASVAPAVKKLKRFRKVKLQPGASETVTFTLSRNDLAFVGQENRWIVEPGTFQVQIGDQTATFELTEN